MTHTPTQTTPMFDGVREVYEFPNGFGASVVRHAYSYGGPAGRWELAVLGPDGELTYDTPVTDDVLGWLSAEDKQRHLDEIAALSPESIAAAKAERRRTEREARIAELCEELARLEAE